MPPSFFLPTKISLGHFNFASTPLLFNDSTTDMPVASEISPAHVFGYCFSMINEKAKLFPATIIHELSLRPLPFV